MVCVDPQDGQLVARIEGQTRDLGISLAWLKVHSNDVRDAREFADLARRNAADYVVVVQPSAAGGLTVYVWSAARSALRQRDVPPPRESERLASSTMAETAALIVRGELSAALTSDQEEAAKPAVASPPTPAVSPPPASNPQPPGPREPAPEERQDRGPERALSVSGAIRVSAPGAALQLAGAWLGLHFEWSYVAVGVTLGTTLPAELERDALRVSLRQTEARVEAFGKLRLVNRLLLSLGASAGFVLYNRSTRSTSSALMKTSDDATWSAVLGPSLQLRWQFAHSVALAARVGVDFIPQPTRFVYRNPDGSRASLGKLAAYEPWAALGLVVNLWE